MADEPQGKEEQQDPSDEKKPEAEEAVPTSEEKEETPPQTEEEQTDSDKVEDLPDGVSERTKEQFDKLKKQLADARAAAKPQASSVYDDIRTTMEPEQKDQRGSTLTDQQINQFAQDKGFVDEEGTVDVESLNQALRDARESGMRAEQRVASELDRMRAQEEKRQMTEAVQQYPQLDKQSEDYNEAFYNQVVNNLMVENYARQGNMSVVEAAEQVAGLMGTDDKKLSKEKKAAIKEFKEKQEDRNQGPIETGKGENRKETQIDELRKLTREGDDAAVAKRLGDLGVKFDNE